MLTNANISQQLEQIFNRAGLSDEQLVIRLKAAIDAGLGQKATNGDALKGLRIIFDLKNRFPSPQIKAEVTQEDEVRMRLEEMSTEERMDYLEKITRETQDILERIKQRRLERKNGYDNKQSVVPPAKLILVESISDHVVPAMTATVPEDTNVRRAVGIQVESKIIKQPVYRLNTESESSEDKHYHQKISYPA